MRPDNEVHEVFLLAAQGVSQTAIAQQVGIRQSTVSRWLRVGADAVLASPMRRHPGTDACPDLCPHRTQLPASAYSYLLGQYLGDGSIVHTRRGVYRLFLACCAAYPNIIEECRAAIGAVMPANRIGQRERSGVVDLTCYSKHWPCLFPQHGPGRKHNRRIELHPWQADVALDLHPELFLRGLIHSDGCRTMNRVRGAGGDSYAYPRYMFTNKSDDIRALFVQACHRLGIESRRMNQYNVSVARRSSVERLDEFVGPKS